jgi:hypothetical protein
MIQANIVATYPKKTIKVTPEQFARMHDIIAEHSFGGEEEAAEQIREEFGLEKYVSYFVKVVY